MFPFGAPNPHPQQMINQQSRQFIPHPEAMKKMQQRMEILKRPEAQILIQSMILILNVYKSTFY